MPVTITEEQKDILDFLQGKNIAVLATADSNCEPHAAAIYFTFDPQTMDFFFVTREDTAKNYNLEHNARAALVINETDYLTTVQVRGAVAQEADQAKRESVITNIWRSAIADGQADAPPFAKMEAGGYVVYRLTPKSIRKASFIRPASGQHDELFEVF